jgi:ethanolamine ammonia-lyase small subunit
MTDKPLKDALKNVSINTIISKEIPSSTSQHQHTNQHNQQHTHQQEWQVLKQFTAARIAIGRAGISTPTQAMLDFQLAHAQAQDAVHLPLNSSELLTEFEKFPIINRDHANVIQLHSQVKDRAEYLQRPDLGRLLNEESTHKLQKINKEQEGFDLAIVIVDGLSSLAIQKNAAEFLSIFYQKINDDAASKDLTAMTLAPLTLVTQGRVAIGDEVAQTLNAQSVLVLIGERPGLSSPDSLGLYYTYSPKKGLTDEARNCISNVRQDGLSFSQAAGKALYLLKESHRRKISGVNLKEDHNEHALNHDLNSIEAI